jgi:hypothetical protein
VTRSFALVVALVASFAGAADAKSKIAITPIDGDEGDAMGDALEAAIDGDELDVTGTRSTGRMLGRLGYDTDLSNKQAKKLGAELDVDAVLVGTLDTKDGHKVLRFRMFVRGKKTRGFTVTFNSERSDRFKDMLRKKLVEKIEGERVSGRDDDEDRDGGDDNADGIASSPGVRVTGRSANRAGIRVDLGVSVQNRSLTFTSRMIPNPPPPYSNTPVPGGRLDVELYPLAFGNPDRVVAGLGLAASFDRTFSLTLRNEQNASVGATQQQWSAGVRLRIPFGGANLPTITLAADYGVRSFTTDRTGLTDPMSLDLADTEYTFVGGGLDVRFPVSRVLAFVVGGRALGVLDAGPIQQPDQYGQSRVFGAQANAGLDLVLGGRYAIRIVGELSQFGFAFVGNGMMSNARDGDPTTKDVSGATDRSFGGAATFGVLY